MLYLSVSLPHSRSIYSFLLLSMPLLGQMRKTPGCFLRGPLCSGTKGFLSKGGRVLGFRHEIIVLESRGKEVNEVMNWGFWWWPAMADTEQQYNRIVYTFLCVCVISCYIVRIILYNYDPSNVFIKRSCKKNKTQLNQCHMSTCSLPSCVCM